MANPADIVVRESASASSGAGADSAVELAAGHTAAELWLRVTACSGTLAVTLQTSLDGAAPWRDVRAFGNVNAPGALRIVVDGLDPWVRASYSVGTSATFAIDGVSEQLYATNEDLESRLTTTVIDRLSQESDDLRPEILINATAEVENALDAQGGLPLGVVSRIVRSKAADIAAMMVVRRVGEPGGGIDKAIEDAYAEALLWCDNLRRRKVQPTGASPAPAPATRVAARPVTGPRVTSNRNSQWDDC